MRHDRHQRVCVLCEVMTFVEIVGKDLEAIVFRERKPFDAGLSIPRCHIPALGKDSVGLVHSGCLVGAWMAMFRGVAGIVCREDKIEVNPHMMPWWDSVSFNFLYHGHKITIKMTNETYTLTTDSDKEIKVVFRGKELSLSKASAVNEKM